MLSPATIAVIKQTVPVLATGAETLTRHFYRRMFAGNPEVRAFFNPAHQHAGTQQRALAAAICAYATHIEDPSVLGPAVEVIAQKHVALGVKPEHYPIVGEHLLGSIREVLGEAATDAVINAWAEAYGLLADLLIRREAEIYAEQERRHGWQGFRKFVVTRKQRESAVITSFHLAPADGGAVAAFEPGQYVTVRVPTADGITTMRNYSLSCGPGCTTYRISVKREPGEPAGFVSNFLHDRVHEGDAIEVAPPAGEFTLDPEADATRPLVLVSGGVGVTPLLSMLHAAVERWPGREVVFVHGANNGEHHAFRREVLDLADRHPNVRVHVRYMTPTRDDRVQELFESEGLVDADLVLSLLGGNPDADVYFCGPKPFMSNLYRGLLAGGVAAERIHFEFFGPAQSLAAPSEAPATVGA